MGFAPWKVELHPNPRTVLRSLRPKSARTDRRSSRFAWFVVIAGMLSAAALATYGFLHGGYVVDVHREWRALAAELQTSGEPVHFADVQPAPVPDAQNFFASEVFSGLAQGAPNSPLLQRAVDPGRGLAVEALLASATQGAGASLDAIASAMQRAGLIRSKTEFLLAGDRVRAGMRTLGLDFDALAAAADLPASRFPIDYAKPFPPLPHLSTLDALGNWLAIRAIAELSTGDSESAAYSLLLIGRLADSVASEPFLASQRTRRLLIGRMAGCVRVGMNWNAWTDEQLARFADTFEKVRLLSDLAWAIRGERAQLNTSIEDAVSGGKPTATEALQSWIGRDLSTLDIRGLRTRQTGINRSAQTLIEALSGSDTLQPAALTPPNAATLPADLQERWHSLEEEVRVAAQIQTYVAQAQTACGLERYRLSRSAYPEQLKEILPEFLSALPPDPMTGQPLHYENKPPASFILTGAGWPDAQPWIWKRE